MTPYQFRMAANISVELAARWIQPIALAMKEFGITTPIQQAMFIAQVGHESASFTLLVESFNYSINGLIATFGKRLSADQASALGRKPCEVAVPLNRQRAIANLVYSGRMGNKAVDDGWKYRGRGLIQITGLDNYRACGTALKLDLISNPDQLLTDLNAVRSAAWFWQSRNCGQYADDIQRVTQLINGGNNGINDRKARFELAKRELQL
ncbi:glycoside hydrolase family 19 protein [Yersinia kristensenii]|uniref:glycoside hydrolase family 19 protein n=1 Tax=Yersinia kristensenii TaxID=28152 RepID=UPI000B6B26A5|nr:glycoside hydrolase family 19 protein [Yersinia kristensenii]MDA5473273.1 glycoside hydrolase family 19 protein [Yersinia kristensenii]MDA5475615.1 glycoside hydrolase family 19 protein [Yersinia kristensenii]MDA5507089.1 glycoside hydrolase family 19 protein [Yersinia kristensenii]MDA5523290.1 glycoside hydrolase family 19 protein [Yersinia kristensenii]NIK96054.1 glycoside hydrolase family 19 protein [Yersinia kristensenii]